MNKTNKQSTSCKSNIPQETKNSVPFSVDESDYSIISNKSAPPEEENKANAPYSKKQNTLGLNKNNLSDAPQKYENNNITHSKVFNLPYIDQPPITSQHNPEYNLEPIELDVYQHKYIPINDCMGEGV